MLVIRSHRNFFISRRTNVRKLHQRLNASWKLHEALFAADVAVVPYVDSVVANCSSGQQLLAWVPFGEEDLAKVLADHVDALEVGNEGDFVGKGILVAVFVLAEAAVDINGEVGVDSIAVIDLFQIALVIGVAHLV